MIRNISIGIDLGSHHTRVVVGEFQKGEKIPKVIGMGESLSLGMRHGYIVNFEDTVNSIKKAVAEAENTSGVKIRRAFVSINSTTVNSEISSGSCIISKADGEITHLDINKAIEDSENNLHLGNKKIIHVYPLSFKLDGKEILGKPEGMRGTKLEVRTLFITCSNQHFEDLVSAVSEAGVEPLNITSGAISSSYIALTERQKMVGVALVNIGAETVSLSVFENNLPMLVHTFSIGSSDITNDIALGLKISLEDAEDLKIGKNELPSRRKLDEIVEARLNDIFELIENYLKKIKRNGLLPAGVVFIGGGANCKMLEEFSKEALSLPAKIGSSEIFGNTKTKLRDSAYFTVLGNLISNKNQNTFNNESMNSFFSDIKNTFKSIGKQLLP